MAYDTAGDPELGRRWIRATTSLIASELQHVGIQICDRTVSRILKDLGFALRVNHKQVATTQHPDRDLQFRIIRMLRTIFRSANLPIISVDTKKKEQIGRFRNGGIAWLRTPSLVYDHDFRSLADCVRNL